MRRAPVSRHANDDQRHGMIARGMRGALVGCLIAGVVVASAAPAQAATQQPANALAQAVVQGTDILMSGS
jgi:predicted Kef-type K+ transport protein